MQMAEDGWQKGWHERNGGNLSYRIRPEEIDSVKEELNPGEWIAIGTEVPLLGGQYFLIRHRRTSSPFFSHYTISIFLWQAAKSPLT